MLFCVFSPLIFIIFSYGYDDWIALCQTPGSVAAAMIRILFDLAVQSNIQQSIMCPVNTKQGWFKGIVSPNSVLSRLWFEASIVLRLSSLSAVKQTDNHSIGACQPLWCIVEKPEQKGQPWVKQKRQDGNWPQPRILRSTQWTQKPSVWPTYCRKCCCWRRSFRLIVNGSFASFHIMPSYHVDGCNMQHRLHVVSCGGFQMFKYWAFNLSFILKALSLSYFIK